MLALKNSRASRASSLIAGRQARSFEESGDPFRLRFEASRLSTARCRRFSLRGRGARSSPVNDRASEVERDVGGGGGSLKSIRPCSHDHQLAIPPPKQAQLTAAYALSHSAHVAGISLAGLEELIRCMKGFRGKAVGAGGSEEAIGFSGASPVGAATSFAFEDLRKSLRREGMLVRERLNERGRREEEESPSTRQPWRQKRKASRARPRPKGTHRYVRSSADRSQARHGALSQSPPSWMGLSERAQRLQRKQKVLKKDRNERHSTKTHEMGRETSCYSILVVQFVSAK